MEYKDRLSTLELLPLSYRRETLDLLLLFKGINHQNCLQPLTFLSIAPNRGRRIGDGIILSPQHCNTEACKSSYFYRIVHPWNSLPDNIRSSHNSQSFKKFVQQFYFDKLITCFETNNMCTWITKCRCPTCRLIPISI